jgi:hypothetical protein
MTNDPAQIAAALRVFVVYAVCAILAIVIGVMMTNPMSYSNLGFIGLLIAVMIIPLLLRWHYPIMLLTWAAPFMMFFLKGDPKMSLVMITLSLAISISERALNQPRFINVPVITWSLICLIAVVAITAKLNGGIGLKAFGSDVIGGKKYIFLIVGILGYFAITARPIPPELARWYVALYFSGGIFSFIGDLYPICPGFLHPIFWVIPPSYYGDDSGGFDLSATRLAGTGWAAVAATNTMIAFYGVRGIFLGGKLWRPVVFFICCILIFFGGFRSALILTAATFLMQFFLEGMHRTKLMPFFIIFCLAGAALVFPLATRLPFTFQRTLAFLPKEIIHLTPEARMAAQDSTDWRIGMWTDLMPQIPKHLLLGKGYAISAEDAENIGLDTAFGQINGSATALAISSDFHNGPISVILPFGIWGVIAFLWFIIASNIITYRNFRYGAPALKTINTFLFTTNVIGTLDFLFIFGDLSGGIAQFVGVLGISICVNRGVCRAPRMAAQNLPYSARLVNARLKPQPAFQRRVAGSNPL